MLKMLSLLLLFVQMLSLASAQTFSLKKYHTGDSFFNAKKYDTAVQIFDGLLMSSIPDSFRAEIFHRKGVMFFKKGIEDSSIYYEERALDLFTRQKNPTKMSRVECTISLVYTSKKIYDKAIEYNLLALSSAQLPSDSLTIYLSLCNVYQMKKEYYKAYNLLVTHIQYFKKKLIYNQEFLISSNFGICYSEMGKHDSALYYYKEALDNASSGKDSSAAYNNLSDEYQFRNNYRQGLFYLDSAYQINRSAGNLASLLASCDSYVEIYTKTGDYYNALKYSNIGRQLSDSIFTNGKADALLEADIKYQAEKKGAANKLLEKDNALKQRNFVFSLIGLGMVALLAAISFTSYRQKRKANNILTLQKTELQQLAQQLELANQTKALLLSTIGHDLRSPLSSLYALLKMQEIKDGNNTSDKIIMSSQITGLLNVLENLLAWSKLKLLDTDMVPVPVNVNIHELYTEQTDFFVSASATNKVTIINNTPENLTVHCDEYILGTILRNAIGNAMNNVQKGKSVILSAERTAENRFCCSVKNLCSKDAFEWFQSAFRNATVQSGNHGLGLLLIKDFARIINASINLAYQEGWAIMNISIQNA